jgi:hypothetical protein
MMATILLYVNAALGVLTLVVMVFPVGTALVAGQLAAGLGIANEKRWGYWLGVVVAVLEIAFVVLYGLSLGSLLNALFYVALVALLLHAQSRSYVRTWFH